MGTADQKVEGTGFGLALSRKFIELHRGRIWVTSEVAKGSTFAFHPTGQRRADLGGADIGGTFDDGLKM